MRMDDKWKDLPAKWASGTLAIDMMVPSTLLTLELESQFKEFNSWIWVISNWHNQAPLWPLYLLLIRWNLMTKEVLRELGVIMEHITDEEMSKPAVDGKNSWIVILLQGKQSYKGLVKSK